METWLEIAPAVDAYIARALGRRPKGVTDVDDYWDDLRAIANPDLSADVFLASRKQEVNALKQWLSGPAAPLAFEARSPAEVVDFVAAFIASLGAVERDAIAARVLIVERREEWLALASEPAPLVLVARSGLPVEPEMVSRAVRNGHHVLVASMRLVSDNALPNRLPRCYRHDLKAALRKSGFEEREAEKYARESGGSLTILKRRLSRFPSTAAPEWSRGAAAAELAPLILTGAWQDDVAGDRKIVEAITGRKYRDVLALANRWLLEDDPPVVQILSRWSLMSREDAWVLLGAHVTNQHLDVFENAAMTVLSEENPQLGLSENERVSAQLKGRKPTHSRSLRAAIAQTLGLLGARPEYLTSDAAGGDVRAGRVVRALLGRDADWRRWASLSNELPVLAEAAPEAFIEAVRRDLRSSQPQRRRPEQLAIRPLARIPRRGGCWPTRRAREKIGRDAAADVKASV